MTKILGVMLTVANLKRMTSFFTEVLTFKLVANITLSGSEQAELTTLQLGKEYLYLLGFTESGNPYPTIHSNDVVFQHVAIVVSDLDAAHKILSEAGIHGISEKPITIPEWNQAAAGIRAYYFKSPEGHPLELIYFPKGKGHPQWQKQQPLFQGIDHTAIVIANTEKSLAFYRDQLGMSVLGESLNHGDTQESLSGVKGAKVQITGLGYPGDKTMGLEFLHYLNPTNGAAIPALSTHDLACTYTVIEMDDFTALEKLQQQSGQFVTYQHGAKPALFLKDIDGHRLILVSKENSHAN